VRSLVWRCGNSALIAQVPHRDNVRLANLATENEQPPSVRYELDRRGCRKEDIGSSVIVGTYGAWERKNSWPLAEFAGDVSPDGMSGC
jgi:hypothetical protein